MRPDVAGAASDGGRALGRVGRREMNASARAGPRLIDAKQEGVVKGVAVRVSAASSSTVSATERSDRPRTEPVDRPAGNACDERAERGDGRQDLRTECQGSPVIDLPRARRR
jgi:hypothetical protein